MLKKPTTWIIGLLALMLALSLFQNSQARHSLEAAQFRGDSLEVALDTAKLVLALTDSSRATWIKRSYQYQLQRDSIDKKLKSTSAVRANFSVRIDTLRFADTALVLSDPQDSIRSAHFEQKVPPFMITADVALQRAGLPGSFSARLDQLGVLDVDVRVTCQETSRSVQAASVVVTAPPPFIITPKMAEQDPRVCNPKTVEPSFHWPTAKKVLYVEGLLAAGYQVWKLLR